MGKKFSDQIPAHMLDAREPDKEGWWQGLMKETQGDLLPPTPSTSTAKWSRCAHSHPPLKITTTEGKTFTMYGGACGDPVHKNLDIYVALDHGTAHDPQAYPWHGTREFIYFPIQDMSTPKDAVEFKAMINWLCDQITAGKSVHVGCLGGHGRTGLVLAAIVKVLAAEQDAITYVRTHYCEKAVETHAQAAWLHTHFGITEVSGYKDKKYNKGWGDKFTVNAVAGEGRKKSRRDARAEEIAKEYGDKVTEIKPVKTRGNIWSRLLTFA